MYARIGCLCMCVHEPEFAFVLSGLSMFMFMRTFFCILFYKCVAYVSVCVDVWMLYVLYIYVYSWACIRIRVSRCVNVRISGWELLCFFLQVCYCLRVWVYVCSWACICILVSMCANVHVCVRELFVFLLTGVLMLACVRVCLCVVFAVGVNVRSCLHILYSCFQIFEVSCLCFWVCIFVFFFLFKKCVNINVYININLYHHA